MKHTNFEKYGIKFYANEDEIIQHDKEVKEIINGINEGLNNEKGYNGFDFCDVSAGGIQIRLFHKDIVGYSVGYQPTILHDWSNVNDVIEKSIKFFKDFNTPNSIAEFKDFIETGRKYGWD